MPTDNLDAERRRFLAKAEEAERYAADTSDEASRESWKLIAAEYRRLAEDVK
jgi:hypothetical protein